MKAEFVVALDVDLHWTVVFLHWSAARTFFAYKSGILATVYLHSYIESPMHRML